MSCNITPLSCLDPANIFAGVYNANCGGFGDPSAFKAERAVYNSGFGELINNFGVNIDYYVNGFNLSAMNSIYGEDTTNEYYGPVTIKSYIQMETPSPVYSLAGFDSGDTLTAYIQMDSFYTIFNGLSVYTVNGQSVEPKSGDKITVTALGCDRRNGRGPKIFEVTEVLDEDISELNPFMGHYIWRIKAVRSNYNGETNEPREQVNNQILDNTEYGKLSSSIFPTLTGSDKKYTQNADDIVQELYGDIPNQSSIYGNYF